MVAENTNLCKESRQRAENYGTKNVSVEKRIYTLLTKRRKGLQYGIDIMDPFKRYGIDHPKDHEIPNGWPFGLGIVNIKLRVEHSLPAAGVEPHSFRMRSSSFSSFPSSNLDTESTASFFQDQSVSLGRLIGLRPGERRSLYLPKSIHFQDHDRISRRDSQSDVSRGGRGQRVMDMSQGICIPLLSGALEKISRNGSKSRK